MADVSRLALNRLASKSTAPNLPAFLEPAETPRLHLATVSKLDPGRNEVSVTLNDYLSPTLDRVPVLGEVLSELSVNDQVQLIQTGKSIAVLGRQHRPTGTVIFT